MAGYKVTAAAEEDLIAIGDFTAERWGAEQCRAYLAQLVSRFDAIGSSPHLGRPCDEIRTGYWRYHEGRHVIFYRVTRKTVEIVRVLHDQMLPRRHL